MIGDPPFNTATMAKLMADQGHCSRAMAIYRELLERHPDHPEYQAALQRLDQLRTGKKLTQLEPILAEWIHLLLKASRCTGR